MKNINRELLNINITSNYNICITKISVCIFFLLDTSTLFYSIEHKLVCFAFIVLKFILGIYSWSVCIL